MKYIIVLLAAVLVSSCALTPQQWNELGDGYQQQARDLANSTKGNSIERCRYWTDYTGNVFKQCN